MTKERSLITLVGYQFSGASEVESAIAKLVDSQEYVITSGAVTPTTMRRIADASFNAYPPDYNAAAISISYAPIHVIRNPLMIAADAVRNKYSPGIRYISNHGCIQSGIAWNKFVEEWGSEEPPVVFWENFLDDPITILMKLLRRVGVDFVITSENTEKITERVEKSIKHENEIRRVRNEIFSLEEDRKAFAPQVDPWLVKHGYEFSSFWWKKEYWDSEESHAIIP